MSYQQRLLYRDRQTSHVYQFSNNDPIDDYDVNGLISPATVGQLAIVGAFACLEPFFLAGLKTYPDDEKMRHCWTSCSAARACSSGLALLAGLGLEALTAAIHEAFGKGVNAEEKANMVRDIRNNVSGIKCAGLSGMALFPVVPTSVGLLLKIFEKPCDCCCKDAPAAP